MDGFLDGGDVLFGEARGRRRRPVHGFNLRHRRDDWIENTSVTNGTAYYYVVSATLNGQESANSNEASATPGGISPAPTNLTATLQNGNVALQWTASNGAATYNVYRGTAHGQESAPPIGTGVAGTAYSDSGLLRGNTYYYQVTAVNSSGESTRSNEAAVGIYAFRVTDMTPGAISLEWDSVVGVPGSPDLSGSPNPSSYSLTRSPGGVPVVVSPATATSATDTFTVAYGTTYTYTLTASIYKVNASGYGFGLDHNTVQTLTVTPQRLPVSDDQAVNGRLDPRYSIATYLNYQFKNSDYNGGLFTGYASDPSTIGRSFLRFSAPALTGSDHLWCGSINLYCTGALAAPPVTSPIGCQLVPDNQWTASSINWGSAPFVNPTAAQVVTSVTYNPADSTVSPWSRWPMTSTILDQILTSQPLCFAVTSTQETTNGPNWMYFARKEYNSADGPFILYGYGQ